MDVEMGSYLINCVMIRSLTLKSEPGGPYHAARQCSDKIGDILAEIQEDLHSKGKQQIVFTTSNKTRSLQFGNFLHGVHVNQDNDGEKMHALIWFSSYIY